MNRYLMTARLFARGKLSGGIAYLLPEALIKACTLAALIFLWRSALLSGVEAELTLPQMLTYTYGSALLSQMLVVKTAATGWLSEGVLLKLYGRPLSVLGQLAAQTAGEWMPMLLVFSLPMAALAPVFGVRLIPASPAFLLSLALCMSLGFAIDVLFACLSIRLRNVSWLIDRIRTAVVTLLSGSVIPIALLPLGMGRVLQYQPFASMGGAALSIFVGVGNTGEILALQLLWNVLLWPLALIIFRKSQEGMVSYGG